MWALLTIGPKGTVHDTILGLSGSWIVIFSGRGRQLVVLMGCLLLVCGKHLESTGCRFSQDVNQMRVCLYEHLGLEASSGSQPDAGSPGVSTGCWFTRVTRVLRLTHSADASSRNPRRIVPMGT